MELSKDIDYQTFKALTILFDDGTLQKVKVKTVWQDKTLGFDKLYYELLYDEPGKGTILSLNYINTWQVF